MMMRIEVLGCAVISVRDEGEKKRKKKREQWIFFNFIFFFFSDLGFRIFFETRENVTPHFRCTYHRTST